MTTSKKTETTTKPKQPKQELQTELQTAYEIHTLAQLIYGRLAATHPWVATFTTPDVFAEPMQWPPTPVAPGFRGEPYPWTR